MDFSAWSPSHTILVVVTVVVTAIGFIAQVAVLFYRMGQTEKRLAESEERSEKRDAELLALMDKRLGEVNGRFGEVNGRFGEVNQRIDGLRSEMNQGFSDIRGEMSKMNQNHIDHLNRHHD